MAEEFPSELRYDTVSGDWVIIATGRAKRPESFRFSQRKKVKLPKKKCPFCNITAEEKILLIYSQGKKINELKNWTTLVIANKFPALLPAEKIKEKKEGKLYRKLQGVGFCEVVITKDHEKHFPHFTLKETKEVFDVYQQRYLELMKKPFVNHVSIFHNHGIEAGASMPHPHSQIYTTPLIDVDLKNALSKAEDYFKKNKKCLYCQMNKYEMKSKKRIVLENEKFIALCPFASKTAFEVIISPKKHASYFEKISEEEKWQLAEIFQKVMKKIYLALNDPAYNFYLHTAPCDGKKYPYYHWHWTILPKTAIPAGFELGTKIEISTITPEKAAEYLRKIA